MPLNSPIFISGLRKSGTSLVKALLDGHPELTVYPPNELHLFRFSHHQAVVKDKQAYEANPSRLKDILADQPFIERMNDPSFQYYTDKIDAARFQEALQSTTVSTTGEIIDAVYSALRESSEYLSSSPETSRFVTKTVLETEFFPELLEWYPDLKFVCVLRNPYGHFNAARNSMRADRSRNKAPEYDVISQPYPFIGAELRRMKGSYYFMNKYQRLHPDRFRVQVFDRLLRNPEEELKALADFLEIDFEDSMLMPTICGDLWGGNSMHIDEFEGLDERPLYHWKDKISGLEIRVINELFDKTIDEYGFEALESEASYLRPLHRSEWNPVTYLANRIIVKWGIDSPETF